MEFPSGLTVTLLSNLSKWNHVYCLFVQLILAYALLPTPCWVTVVIVLFTLPGRLIASSKSYPSHAKFCFHISTVYSAVDTGVHLA